VPPVHPPPLRTASRRSGDVRPRLVGQGPAFDLSQAANVEAEDQAAVGDLLDGLARVPGGSRTQRACLVPKRMATSTGSPRRPRSAIISARPYVEPDILTFTVPWAIFREGQSTRPCRKADRPNQSGSSNTPRRRRPNPSMSSLRYTGSLGRAMMSCSFPDTATWVVTATWYPHSRAVRNTVSLNCPKG